MWWSRESRVRYETIEVRNRSELELKLDIKEWKISCSRESEKAWKLLQGKVENTVVTCKVATLFPH